MANINVSYSEMEQAATQLGTGCEQITDLLRSMQSRISGLVGSGFVTEHASPKFNTSYTEYTMSANTVIEKLTEIQAFLTHTAQAMREMDAQIAARIH
jgi:WXG100 family type VII secretion target